jgi:hypothetical protein
MHISPGQLARDLPKGKQLQEVVDILPLLLALPHLTSAFSTFSNFIPRKEAWGDSAGPVLSFPLFMKQQ